LKKILYFFVLFCNVSILTIESKKLLPNFFAVVCGAFLGELHTYTNKGILKYPEVTLTSKKKSYSEQVYSKIFQEIASAIILEKLYQEVFADFWNKQTTEFALTSDHDSLFREILFFVLGWRKSVLKIKTGAQIIFETKENSKEGSHLYVTALLIGITKFLVDDKIKNFIKERIGVSPTMMNRPQFFSIFSEILKIGLNELIVLPTYYSFIGLLTLSCSQLAKEKNKVFRAMVSGLEKKSVTNFYSNLEDANLFLVSEAGFTAAKSTSTFLKVIKLFRNLI
jgi:hypothetical protein